jgi:4-hydroxy-tetrahydrodipicolinate reductase
MSAVLRVALAGATGRLGRRIVALSASDPEVALVAALTREGHPLVGRDAGEYSGVAALGIYMEATPRAAFDVLIDASTPAGTRRWLEICVERQLPIVVATTGHDAAGRAAIEEASQAIPVLKASNLALGAILLRLLASDLVRRLGKGFDVEIVEAHHREKRDRPSGTALDLARALEEAGGTRPPIASLRLGGLVGEHTVHFASGEEELVLSHRALSRDAFARGALRGAKWLAARDRGLYDLDALVSSA